MSLDSILYDWRYTWTSRADQSDETHIHNRHIQFISTFCIILCTTTAPTKYETTKRPTDKIWNTQWRRDRCNERVRGNTSAVTGISLTELHQTHDTEHGYIRQEHRERLTTEAGRQVNTTYWISVPLTQWCRKEIRQHTKILPCHSLVGNNIAPLLRRTTGYNPDLSLLSQMDPELNRLYRPTLAVAPSTIKKRLWRSQPRRYTTPSRRCFILSTDNRRRPNVTCRWLTYLRYRRIANSEQTVYILDTCDGEEIPLRSPKTQFHGVPRTEKDLLLE